MQRATSPGRQERRQGLFVSFEGGEGSGKSTQAQRLWERLRGAGHPAELVREPGTTALGLTLRDLLKGGDGVSPGAELALFAAARAELVEKVIKPELAKGTIIVADRYLDSTVAYQGYGRNLPLEVIESLNAFVTQGIKPRLTFLLDLDPAVGLQRANRGMLGGVPERHGRVNPEGERFEEEPLAFHRRVRRGYLAQAKAEPDRFVVLDAARPPDELAEAIWEVVSALLANASLRP